MAANRRKAATTAAAVAVAAAVALGGTFAWQSISQTALNEASDVVNPGGRLHDDFNGENKDVYVENFADEPIFARIKLEEYFEIIANYQFLVDDDEDNDYLAVSTQLLGSKIADKDEGGNETGTYTYVYEPFKNYASLTKEGALKAGVSGDYGANAEEGAPGYAYWSWKTGGSTVYMPTFNMNKDSLAADVNGIYEDGNVGTISDRVLDMTAEDAQYSEYKEYTEGETLTGDEIYDADANSVEEEDRSGVTTVSGVEHTAKPTESATLISMADWNGTPGPYWVYDADGWVYWAQAIEPGTATGLLLDGIELNQVMDDTWYYAINVVAQFITADDLGRGSGTGFYDLEEGTAPTAEALALLKAIGVEVEEENRPTYSVQNYSTGEDLASGIEPGGSFNVYPGIDVALYTSDNSYRTADGASAWTFSGHSGQSAGYVDDWGPCYRFSVSLDEPVGTVITFAHEAANGGTYALTATVVEHPEVLTVGYQDFYAGKDNSLGASQGETLGYSTSYFEGDVSVALYDEDGEEVLGAVDAENSTVTLPAGVWGTSYVLTAVGGDAEVSVRVDIQDEYALYLDGVPVVGGPYGVLLGEEQTLGYAVHRNGDLSTDLASELSWELGGNSSEGTTVDGGLVTIAADETSGDMRLKVSGEHGGDSVWIEVGIRGLTAILEPVASDSEYEVNLSVPLTDGKYLVSPDLLRFENLEDVVWGGSFDKNPNDYAVSGLTFTIEKFEGSNALIMHVDADYITGSYCYVSFIDPKSDVTLHVTIDD